MGTVVTVRVADHGETAEQRDERAARVAGAMEWFRRTEACCSRFDAGSEICRLAASGGAPFAASPILFQAVRFAVALAHETDGAFDPTIGHAMAAHGFDRNYRTGAVVAAGPRGAGTFRDVEIDDATSTITLHAPLQLDLGAVAKGLAVDLAAHELAPLEDFAIDAGGDLYLAGVNERGEPWSVGIRHPRREGEAIETLRVSNQAVCTSGDYERRGGAGHHILDALGGGSAGRVASVTVVAPLAMVADALGTAAFVLGPERGLDLLARHGAEGLIVTPELERFATPGLPRG